VRGGGIGGRAREGEVGAKRSRVEGAQMGLFGGDMGEGEGGVACLRHMGSAMF
jgi:hypothetical protein